MLGGLVGANSMKSDSPTNPTPTPDTRPWHAYLTAADRKTLAEGRFGRRVGFGGRLALVVIDVQNYMIGPPPGSPYSYPVACGRAAAAALERLVSLVECARARSIPIFFTQNQFRRDGADMGVYRLKRDLLDEEGWCLEGSEGAAIHEAVAPRPEEVVLVKCKPSAFVGTPLLGMLVAREIDTVIVTGGSTANCVRATAVDAASLNLRTIVVEDCVFDRFEFSHLAALFDIDRQYGDVVSSYDVIARFEAGSTVRGS